jgi:hypothetical protein
MHWRHMSFSRLLVGTSVNTRIHGTVHRSQTIKGLKAAPPGRIDDAS